MATFHEELAEKIYINPNFKRDFRDLLRYHFASYSQNGNSKQYPKNLQIKRLVETALIMASSPNDLHRRISFELATLLFESVQEDLPGLNAVMKLICTRLGNIPAINLINQDLISLPRTLDVESEIHILENTLEIDNRFLRLTKFQLDSFNLLSEGFSVSLSAPTSAGKSFLITQFVASRFSRNGSYVAVVVVPTRALIRQITRDFYDVFNEYDLNKDNNNGKIEFITSSVEIEGNVPSQKRLFILTPERLQAILYSWKTIPEFDLLVIDEAQKIADSSRGIILEDIIIELANTQADLQSIFLSPLSSNPDLLLSLLNPATKAQSIFSSVSPVAQHVYSVTTPRGDRRRLLVNKLNSGLDEFTFEIPLKSSLPTGKAKGLAFVAQLFGSKQSNILYANGAVEAERMALALVEYDLVSTNSPDVDSTVEYLSNVIHEEYYLVNCLKKGVAYHYGAMPDIARIGVEDLFKDNLISYVACTSTLLEGVNLPAKNIFIDDPKLGRASMSDSSFWNLAGRAGRLMKDFSGNVFCVNSDNWDKPVLERKKLYKIESSLSKTLNDPNFVHYCLKIGPQIDISSFEQAANNLVLKYKEKGQEVTEAFIESRVSSGTKESLLSSLKTLAETIILPLEILKKNKSIDFRLQQDFVEYLAELSNERLLRLIPQQPFSPNSYEMLQATFDMCDKFLILTDRGERFKFFTTIAHQWIREESLRDMIRRGIQYRRTRGMTIEVNSIIREIVDALNDEIRFYYVRNVKCFCDLLQFELDRRGLSEDDYLPYSDFGLTNYLELGMSYKGTIQLHNLGLSRTTAIEVNDFCRQRGVGPNEVVSWVRNRVNEISRQLARPLRAELLRVFG